jgi:hypothetical protein
MTFDAMSAWKRSPCSEELARQPRLFLRKLRPP